MAYPQYPPDRATSRGKVQLTRSSPLSGAGRTVVYTDGACSGNPGPGGWAWALPEGAWRTGYAPATTNQRMELSAVIDAVAALPGPLLIVSDSTYVVNCFRDKWYLGWKRRGWRAVNGKPVANRDLWEPLITQFLGDPARLSFTWVKGHSNDPYNALVDSLAVRAGKSQSAQQGGPGQ